jgi:alanine dehydrogenase
MLILNRSDVERVLDYPSCIAAVEDVFRMRAKGEPTPSAVLGVHAEGGGFHVKAAAVRIDGRELFAAKINANFPGNPVKHGLPTIQGMLGLFDAELGVPLALIDSLSITTIRTAAATAVAAKYLALPESRSLAIIGCGVQAYAHVAAIRAVRSIERVVAYDNNPEALARFVSETGGDLTVSAMGSLSAAVADAEIVVTCTPARRAFLERDMVRPGVFIGAVGTDHEYKSEIAPELMAEAAVVVDDLDQCAVMGDLHHAIAAGTMTRDNVRAALGVVVVDPARGRSSKDEIVVFDSTGVAIEDVAAAAVALRRAEAQGIGSRIVLNA